MKVIQAKHAGFCFGVNRAVNYIYACADKGEKICTIGPIIHNMQVVDDLKGRGVYPVENINDVAPGYKVAIRTHGVEKYIIDELQEKNIEYVDLTCPFVLKIHNIVMNAPKDSITLIAGDENHPEVKGIRSRCVNESYVFSNEKELQQILERLQNRETTPIICVSQTTFDKKILKNCLKLLKKVCTNCKMFDTICNATSERQSEAYELSRKCDAMVVIGGRHSSNTCKLKNVCMENSPTFHIENARELSQIDFSHYGIVGVTAGASTPSAIIKEVLKTMSEENKELDEKEVEVESSAETDDVHTESEAPSTEDVETVADADEEAEVVDATEEAAVIDDTAAEEAEVADTAVEEAEVTDDTDATEDAEATKEADANATEEATESTGEADENAQTDGEESFAEILEESMRDYVPDKVVKGTVVNITPTEVYVDVPRRKQAGIIQKEDLSFDNFDNCSYVVSVGDELDLIIMKVDDQSGILKLSKRLVDRYKVWSDIDAAKESGEVLEGVVTGAKDYGVFVNIKGASVFVPSPLTGLRRGEPNNQLLGQKVKLIIIETKKNKSRQSAVGSIKAVLVRERRAAAEKMWDTFEEGMVLKGVVKSLTPYGAFVDVGGIIGLIHISEMSWVHIKHPSDILEVGQEVEVSVISADKEKNKLSLRLRKDEDSPWEILKKNYSVGDVVEVKIVRLTDFGAFAEIIPGVDGLIHISQISLNRIKAPSECLSVGDVVNAKIIEINSDKKRVGLSIKSILQEQEQETIDAQREEIEKYLLHQNSGEDSADLDETQETDDSEVADDTVVEHADEVSETE